MKSRFTNFPTLDHLNLNGILYEPEDYTNKIAIFLHGNGGSDIFRKIEENEMYAEVLTNAGISCSFFNNRGSGFITKYRYFDQNDEKVRIYSGTTFELIEECVADIDSAIKTLKEYGYSEFYIIGHSSGANKAVVYNYLKPKNEISKFILSEGGDDTGLFYENLKEDTFNEYLETAMGKISDGKGMDIVPVTIFGMWLSWQSLYDIINPDGLYNIFSYYQAVNKTKLGGEKKIFRELLEMPNDKTHYIYADEDGFSEFTGEEKIRIINEHLNREVKSRIITNTDHGYTGREEEYIDLISMMLRASE